MSKELNQINLLDLYSSGYLFYKSIRHRLNLKSLRKNFNSIQLSIYLYKIKN